MDFDFHDDTDNGTPKSNFYPAESWNFYDNLFPEQPEIVTEDGGSASAWPEFDPVENGFHYHVGREQVSGQINIMATC
jgi:hypothetical protein